VEFGVGDIQNQYPQILYEILFISLGLETGGRCEKLRGYFRQFNVDKICI
jgi:hypothetical protein